MVGWLQNWANGPARKAIVSFVETVCDEASPDYVAPSERIAVFDNDGTLWCEKPFYFQGYFLLERLEKLAPAHPDWAERDLFRAALERDWNKLGEFGPKGLLELAVATHGGTTVEEFDAIVREWLARARHPKFGRPFTEIVFQPMIELLEYLAAHRFKIFIVSGGGIEFIRTFSEPVYGIPPDRVIGSSIVTRYESRDGVPSLVRISELNFLDDKEGKPVGIQQHIGRRPIAAFGNSDGDLQMLEWVMSGPGRRLGVLVHHDDAEREYAYDRGSPVGALEKGLKDAGRLGLTIVSMKDDWRRVFAFEE